MKFLSKLRWFRSPSPAPSSSQVAKERLKVALTYDRSGLARGTIEQLGDEIIQLIAKHLAIREADIQIHFDRTPEGDKLIASIPLQMKQRPRVQTARAAATKKAPHRRHRHRRRPAH